ncbi:MAG: hypothetical protein LCH26_03660 [Proteobacteria bacterium]|nr:hypothetical protein [Pseudomonadota bacterium]
MASASALDPDNMTGPANSASLQFDTDHGAQRYDVRHWREKFKANTSPPLSPCVLEEAQKAFTSQGALAQWICLVGDALLNEEVTNTSNYVAHLIDITSLYAPSKKRMDDATLVALYPDIAALRDVTMTYLKLNELVERSTPAHEHLADRNGITKGALQYGFRKFCQHYAKRLTQTDGTMPMAGAKAVMGPITGALGSRMFSDLGRGKGWERKMLEKLITQTPDLDQASKTYLEGHLKLAQAATHQKKMPKDEALNIIKDCAPLIAHTNTTQRHAQWAFPLLATAYHALGEEEQCLETWEAFEKWHASEQGWHIRDIIKAVHHHASFSRSEAALNRWWARYQKQDYVNDGCFSPTYAGLTATTNITSALMKMKRYDQVESLSRKLLAYMNETDAQPLQGRAREAWSMCHFKVSLNLAKALTFLGRHEEAAALYGTYFIWHNDTLYVKKAPSAFPEHDRALVSYLCEEADAIVATLAQAGHLNAQAAASSAQPKKSPHKRRGDKKAPSSTQDNARKASQMGSAAKKHLIDHYGKRIQEITTRLEDMSQACERLHVPKEFTQALATHKQDMQKLHTCLLKSDNPSAQKAPHTGKKKSNKSKKKDPTISEIGQRIDAFSQSLSALDGQLKAAQQEHYHRKQKELEAYLASHNTQEGTHTPFALQEAAYEVPTERQKQKTHGAPRPGMATKSDEQEPMAPELPRTSLFMKKQADADYGNLTDPLRKRFLELALEIAADPYDTKAGQGRPERLVSKGGIYFSRRLSDGDRVVYELIKGENGAALQVVFLSLLGHYETLERDKTSTHIQPLVLQNAPREKS